MTNWKTKDDTLRNLINKCGDVFEEQEIVKAFKENVIPYIKTTEPWKSMPESFFEECDKANTIYTLNNCLEQLYDYADENKIWIGM